MTANESRPEDALRLERLWAGEFGDEYVGRNADAHLRRGQFWHSLLSGLDCHRALEVGCNIGGNLRWLVRVMQPTCVYGVDINRHALGRLRGVVPDVNAVWSPARELPFRDHSFDLVFTMGVLIHQPASTLPLVMEEMVRCSSRWVLCGEYFAPEQVDVPYRGHDGALFKRDYGRLFSELFPDLRPHQQGFLGSETGWDDVNWWLFEKRS